MKQADQARGLPLRLKWSRRRGKREWYASMGLTYFEVYPRGDTTEYNFRVYRRGAEIAWCVGYESEPAAQHAAEHAYVIFARREAEAMANVLQKFGAP